MWTFAAIVLFLAGRVAATLREPGVSLGCMLAAACCIGIAY